MAPNSIFGRDDDSAAEAPADPKEGVRLLKSDEVAEVAERAETARRRGPDEKKYGDRPESPSADVRPAMRFPLAGSADPSDLGRPKPAPVVAPNADEAAADEPVSDESVAHEPVTDEPHTQGPDADDGGSDEIEVILVDDVPVAEHRAPEPDDELAVDPAARLDDDLDDEPNDEPDDEPVVHEPAPSGPVLSVGPPTGETTLPHWTEPATGEVPRVVTGSGDGNDEDDRWAAFASSPRWRDEHTDWSREEDTGFHDLVADDEDTPMGALDESDRLMDEEYLTFDDLDVPDAAPPASTLGTHSDPIKIQRAAAPAAASGEARRSGNPARAGANRGSAPAKPATSTSGRDRDQAVRVGIAIAVGALVVMLIGAFTPLKFLPLLLVVPAVVGCMGEFFNATTRAGFRPITVVGLLAGVAMPLAAYFAGSPAVPAGESGIMLVLTLTIAASMAWYLFGAGKGRPVANIAITLAGILYIAVLGSYASLILRAGPWPGLPRTTIDQGIPLFILIGVGTTMYDAAGYLIGSRIGKTPLSAASPNKTIEGLLTGMAATLITVLFLGAIGIGVQNAGQALILGFVLAVVAPVGDLFESMIKRDLGVKDMSNLIPAHGGLLDRVDAYLFTLPAAYYTLRMLGLI